MIIIIITIIIITIIVIIIITIITYYYIYIIIFKKCLGFGWMLQFIDTFSASRSLNFLDLRGSRITAAREDREALMAST